MPERRAFDSESVEIKAGGFIISPLHRLELIRVGCVGNRQSPPLQELLCTQQHSSYCVLVAVPLRA